MQAEQCSRIELVILPGRLRGSELSAQSSVWPAGPTVRRWLQRLEVDKERLFSGNERLQGAFSSFHVHLEPKPVAKVAWLRAAVDRNIH